MKGYLCSLSSVLTISYYVTILNVLTCTTSALKSDAYDLVLTLEEKNALELFKQEVLELLPEAFMKTDFYLIRWLRGANLNIAGARTLLFQTVKWRQENNISAILSEDWSDIAEECPMTFDGDDKDGRPDAGDWDMRSASLQGRLPRILRYFQYANEKQMRSIFQTHAETGKPVTRFVIVLDAMGINLRQHVTCPLCLTTIMQWYTSSEVHYPEFLGEVVVINAPSAVPTAMSLLRPVMAEDIRERIKIFDSNRKAWMTYLNSRIDKSHRRERYGGTLTEDGQRNNV